MRYPPIHAYRIPWASATIIGSGRQTVFCGLLVTLSYLLGLAGLPEATAQLAKPAPNAGEVAPRFFAGTAMRSRLVFVGRAKGGRGLVALGEPDADDFHNTSAWHKNGLLSRELIRQAMLIAARDELGLVTRDAVLGESIPASPDGPMLRLGSFVISGDGSSRVNHAFVTRGDGDIPERLFVANLPCPYPPDGSLARLVERAEVLSRTEFPGLLRKLGATGKPNDFRAEARVSAAVEQELAQLGLTGPFAAVRALHETIRSDGESYERLEAIIRGYAMLGVLSEFQWHAAHKAYKARALLYAQRLVARAPKNPGALWHRAFAEALVGMHRDAIDDLSAAKAIEAGRPTARPDWVDLIDAMVKHDTHRLAAAQGPQPRLAALLNLMAVEYPVGTRQTIHAARRVVELAPECFLAHDALCRAGGVANGHTATSLGPEVFATRLPGSLKAMPGIPAAMRAAIDRADGHTSALLNVLEKSGTPEADQSEPSWGALSHLLRETHFLQVYRRLHFMRFAWGVPTDDYWDEARPSVIGHRFYPFLEMIAAPTGDPVKEHPNFFNRLEHMDVELSEIAMLDRLGETNEAHAVVTPLIAWTHRDPIARDLAEAIQRGSPVDWLTPARQLLEVSPNSPFALGTLIEHDKHATDAQVSDWAKKAPHSPVVLGALARRHIAKNRTDEAERELARYVAIEPECWAIQTLAAIYRARGDMKRWQETLERGFEAEETGLEHTQFRVQIADYLMESGQYERAKEYAEDAGESWAAWAMPCAQRCAEGLKDWTRAELWARRVSERYPGELDSLFRWYLFCVKTGKGDRTAARRYTDEVLREMGGIERLHPDYRGYYRWFDGDLKGAASAFRESYKQRPYFGNCLRLIAISERQGDHATADVLRKQLEKYRQQAPEIIRIVEILPETLRAVNSDRPDLRAVNRVLDTMPAKGRPGAELWIGLFLEAHGRRAAARPFFEHCVISRVIPEWDRAIAGQALRAGPQ